MSNTTNMQRPLEGLLRPPLEWYSAITALVLIGAFLNLPEWFWIPQSLLMPTCFVLASFTLLRGYQGLKIWRYTHRLKKMPTYTMSSKELPVKADKVFIGTGFMWGTIHTQRLRDLDLSYNQHYIEDSSFHAWARRKEIDWVEKPLLKHIARAMRSNAWYNPVRPYPDIGGSPQLHGISMEEHEIYLALANRTSHVIVVGQPGVGKTRFSELIIGQDIRRGDVVIVVDPKGDNDLVRRMIQEAKLAGREKDVRVIHLGFPKLSCRYNPIGSFTKLSQVATRIANALPSSGEAASFKEFAWKYVNLVARGLVMMELKPTYRLIHYYIKKLDILFSDVFVVLMTKDADLRINFEEYRTEMLAVNSKKPISEESIKTRFVDHFVASVGREVIQTNLHLQLMVDLCEASTMDKTYYDKITASVGPLFEKFTTGEVADVLSPRYDAIEDDRPILDWLNVIRQKQIVYIGLDALTDSVISSAVGASMLSDLTALAGHLYKFGTTEGFPEGMPRSENQRIYLHVDEFNEVIGDEFVPLLNKARGAGFSVTAYTQTVPDIQARVKDGAKAEQIMGNLGAMIMFRSKEKKTVEQLVGNLPKVPILSTVPASSSGDTPHGAEGIYYQSSNEDRFSYQQMPLISESDVENLPKGQAFARIAGGKLFKLRLPMPIFENEENLSMEDLLRELPQNQSQFSCFDILQNYPNEGENKYVTE